MKFRMFSFTVELTDRPLTLAVVKSTSALVVDNVLIVRLVCWRSISAAPPFSTVGPSGRSEKVPVVPHRPLAELVLSPAVCQAVPAAVACVMKIRL